jgi:hypothetical protein
LPSWGFVLVHRHQLDRGDAQFLQVRDLVDDAGEGAARSAGTPELARRVKPRTCIS